MRTIVVLFTRDLRVHDNPALASAARAAERVVPLYVADPADNHSHIRETFLAHSIADLRESLRKLGADLLIRQGDRVEQTLRVCQQTRANGVAVMDDFGQRAQAWRDRLRLECERLGAPLREFDSATVLAPGDVVPTGGSDHYKVFTPYWRAWSAARWRDVVETPRRLELPEGLTGTDHRTIWGEREVNQDFPGGEAAALNRSEKWLQTAANYADIHDDLSADATSRLSPYLHFGCISARALAEDEWAPEAMVRQLCWRDFYHQVLAAFPTLATEAYRTANDEWADDPEALQAWQWGKTGVPIVDAGMRQLLQEGWMHNRARLITASFLTKIQGLDWRAGAAWFDRHLLDADEANNYGNWQWTAGTGNDTKPYRRFNPDRQAQRFDPDGVYTNRWLQG
ncbi:cryptochrome/photolyase family protein [Natronoglycomyces albus]|uniref:Deoxyribodipyrimidine photo-lyase n=1 Tax=Natronoglycomyces albus TaxID=2811108 RepID=A0A895XSW3_9ACTN|nr:deoxyribodipyrimidine photo-lyase [Natronoglycomyces albus]QSB06409.1 deoxyribodipyrimidine photo-lyase [Natronoglycomyces albus]